MSKNEVKNGRKSRKKYGKNIANIERRKVNPRKQAIKKTRTKTRKQQI